MDSSARPRLLRYASTLVVLLLLTERAAHAYTDPGSGLLLWQAIMAGLVGLMFYLRKLFGRKSKPPDDSQRDGD